MPGPLEFGNFGHKEVTVGREGGQAGKGQQGATRMQGQADRRDRQTKLRSGCHGSKPASG